MAGGCPEDISPRKRSFTADSRYLSPSPRANSLMEGILESILKVWPSLYLSMLPGAALQEEESSYEQYAELPQGCAWDPLACLCMPYMQLL